MVRSTFRHAIALVSIAALATIHAASAQELSVKDTGEGPAQRVVLENAYVRATLNPAQGGRIESFIHKGTKRDLTMPLGETVPGGLLSDQLWQQNFWHGDWTRAAYSEKVLEQTRALIKVEVASPPGPRWTGLTFRKVLTLRQNSTVLEAAYTMSTDQTADPRCRPDFHFHQGLAGRGKVFLPTESGVVARPLSTEPEAWAYDPSRGWMAYVQYGGAGLAASFDFKRVMAYRMSQTPCMTMEWIFRKADFKPGTTESTPIRLAAFSGLGEVSAVGEQAAAEIQVSTPVNGAAQLKLNYAPFQTFEGKLTVYARSLKEKAAATVLSRTLSLQVDKVTKLSEPIKLPGTGNWVVQAVLQADGMTNLACEEPVFTPLGSGTYAMLPREARIPEQPDTPTKARYKPLDLQFNSTAIPTPHREWAKKWAGGRPRVLILMPDGAEREAVEMAQRFDMDITTAFITKDTYYSLGDAVLGLKQAQVDKNVVDVLDRDYDVMVISCYNAWGLLPGAAKEKVLDKINAGTSLVMPLRGAPPNELKDVYPLTFQGYDHASGTYTLTKDEPSILNALPYEALPVSFSSNGSVLRRKPGGALAGTVLLRAVLNGADRGPMVAVTEKDDARLVFTHTEGSLIPSYGKFFPREDNERALPPFDYWEYHYAMMARLIYWAAHKEGPVTLLGVDPVANEVKVRLRSQTTGPAKLEVTIRDKFGVVVETKTQDVELTEEENVFTVPLADAGKRGGYLCDIKLSNDKGVLTFGAGVFPRGGVTLTKLQPAQAMYSATEAAAVTATIDGALPAGATLRVEVWDGAERCASAAEAPATATTTVNVPLQRVIGQRYQVRATLRGGGNVLDQMAAEGRIRARRDPNKYLAFFWGGIGAGVPENVLRSTYKMYESLGLNAEWEGEAQISGGARFLQYMGWPYASTAGTGMYTNGGVTKQKAAEAPVEEGNTTSDPKGPAKYFASGAKQGKLHRDDNILFYSAGDENRGSLKDVDFSESGRRALRDWLQKSQYKSLAELNTEWATDFKSWDEVDAMTEEEVRVHFKEKKSCAPWLDQRRYMVWATAKLGKGLADGVLSEDPAAIIGESGTQEPAVYGTDRDWWQMSRAYTGLASYGGEQTVQQESYNPTMVRYAWSGYGKPMPYNRVAFYNILGRFDKGIAIFAAASHIDPDYTLPECGRALRAAMLELRSGVGQMLVSAKAQYQPVYVLQSHSSMLGAYMMGADAVSRSSRGVIAQLLGDLNISYRYVSYEQLAAGQMLTNGGKVLILPVSSALSHAEMDAIRAWVKAGGTVIADVQVGMMTAHGRLYPAPQLGDVFGIDRSKVELVTGKKDEAWTVAGPDGAPMLQLKTVERGITGTAKPLLQADGPGGAVPLLFHNVFGKGHAYYWATDIVGNYDSVASGYSEEQATQRIQFIQTWYNKILKEAGVEAPLVVRLRNAQTGALEGACPWMITNYKKSGNIRYITVFRNYAVGQAPLADVAATLQLKEPGAIYDVMSGRLLGEGDTLDLSVHNVTGRVLAVLPAPITAVRVAPPAACQRGQDATFGLEVQATKPTTDPRVLRVDVSSPDGAPNLTYSRDVITTGPTGSVKIPFALNDATGAWRVRVTDVASGVASEVTATLS